jgi:hypothetical protein
MGALFLYQSSRWPPDKSLKVDILNYVNQTFLKFVVFEQATIFFLAYRSQLIIPYILAVQLCVVDKAPLKTRDVFRVVELIIL